MERERLLFCIDRFDHYYDSINNKSAVFLAWGTFMVGGLVASYPYIRDYVNFTLMLQIFYLISMALGLIAIITILIAAIPYITGNSRSFYYFKSIATVKKNDFCTSSRDCTEKEDLIDLRNQVHDLASGLRIKFQILRFAGIFFLLMLFVVIILIGLVTINLK